MDSMSVFGERLAEPTFLVVRDTAETSLDKPAPASAAVSTGPAPHDARHAEVIVAQSDPVPYAFRRLRRGTVKVPLSTAVPLDDDPTRYAILWACPADLATALARLMAFLDGQADFDQTPAVSVWTLAKLWWYFLDCVVWVGLPETRREAFEAELTEELRRRVSARYGTTEDDWRECAELCSPTTTI